MLQIEVHPDLADVLKAYAKAVIRTQPENLVEFSAKWVLVLTVCQQARWLYSIKRLSMCNTMHAADGTNPVVLRLCVTSCRYFADLAAKAPAHRQDGAAAAATAGS